MVWKTLPYPFVAEVKEMMYRKQNGGTENLIGYNSEGPSTSMGQLVVSRDLLLIVRVDYSLFACHSG